MIGFLRRFIISIDLPSGPSAGYRLHKIPIFRGFPSDAQKLHLVRAESHPKETKECVLRLLGGDQLDYLFIDADHTYEGVSRDFAMCAPLVRKEGLLAFHDIVSHNRETRSEVEKFWNEIKRGYEHLQIIEPPKPASYRLQ